MPRSMSRSRAPKRARSRSRAVSRGRTGPVASRPGYRAGTFRARKRIGFSLNTHSFSRYGEAGTVTFNAIGQAVDFEFKFNQIINYTEFSTMFDNFRIDYVVLKLQLISNPYAAAQINTANNVQLTSTYANSNNWFPKLWYIRDYDGGGSENLSTMKERQGAKFFVMKPNREYSIKVVPKVAVQTYRTSTSTGYAPKRLFLDINNGLDVPHYGIKTVFDTLGIDPVDGFQVRWETKFYFTCKDVR